MERSVDTSALVRYALDLGEAMLVSGGEVSRVEDTLSRILKSYGATRVDVFTILSCISLSATFPDGAVETQIRRVGIQAYANDFFRLERLNALSRALCIERPAVPVFSERLDEVLHARVPQRGSEFFRCLGYMLAGGSFTVFFGGSLLDGVAGMLVSLFVWAFDRLLKKADFQRLFHSFLVSFLAGIAALFAVFTGIGAHAGQIMMGVIMLLIPGIAITNSMRDILIGDTISGILRLVESVLIACSVAAGFAVAILLSRGLLPDAGLDTMAREPALQVLTAALGALGFGMVFRLPYRRLLRCMLGGGLTWLVYLLADGAFANALLASGIAAAFGACYAEIMARLCKAPAILFTMPTLIALIPGGSLYIAMDYLVGGNEGMALLYGSKTVVTALAIALGIVLVAASTATLRRRASHHAAK